MGHRKVRNEFVKSAKRPASDCERMAIMLLGKEGLGRQTMKPRADQNEKKDLSLKIKTRY